MQNFNKIFIIYGLKRSGNHAIIKWITSQGKFRFYNNVIPIVPILRGDRKLADPAPFSTWVKQHVRPDNKFNLFKRPVRDSISLMVSLEDHDLSTVPFTDIPGNLTTILILRDPINMFASRIRKSALLDSPAYPKTKDAYMERVILLWKKYASEFLGHTHVLQNKICISFNAWHISPDYRKKMAEMLGLEFTDAGFQHVSRIGGGSSFDNIKFDNAGMKMNVLDRVSALSDQEQMLLNQILDDRDLISLYQSIEKELSDE